MKLILLPKYKAIGGGEGRAVGSCLQHTVHKRHTHTHIEHKSCLQAQWSLEKCVKSYSN